MAGEIEAGTNGQNRWGAGANYQINERSRLYARYEQRTGLGSASSLNPSDRANSFVAGVDNTFASGPTVYSEFRMRDSLSSDTALARDMQLGSGVRNTWNYAPGVTYTAGAEYLRILNGINRDAFAINGGIDYSVDPLWRTSARLEYRRVFNDNATVVDDTQDQYLSTVSLARKIDRDWTLLARNYLLYQNNHSAGTRLEDRFQIGAAWRPVDHNRWNALARYEFKTVRDAATTSAVPGDNYRAHIVSLHSDYHPTRPWWFNGRAAAKMTTDKTLPSGQQDYSAYLLGGRATYEVTEKWDVGVMTSLIYSPQGLSRQWAQGAEVGYLVQTNLWLSLGVNWRGFSDRELTGSDYTNRGVYVRLRYKFDGEVLKGKDTDVKRALNR
jgi:predicted porin